MLVTFLVSARVLCEFRLSSLRKQCLPCESPADEADYPGILTIHSASCTETVTTLEGEQQHIVTSVLVILGLEGASCL